MQPMVKFNKKKIVKKTKKKLALKDQKYGLHNVV